MQFSRVHRKNLTKVHPKVLNYAVPHKNSKTKYWNQHANVFRDFFRKCNRQNYAKECFK